MVASTSQFSLLTRWLDTSLVSSHQLVPSVVTSRAKIGEQHVPDSTNTPLIARAVLRDIRHTPQKARRIVDLIRGQRADQALSILKFAPQAAGSDVFTLLNSAVANAKAKNPAIRDASELWVVEALVDEGRTMKRFRPRAQGRGFRILKRSSHISVAVSDVKTASKTMNKKGATK